jgi:hypothetical protein
MCAFKCVDVVNYTYLAGYFALEFNARAFVDEAKVLKDMYTLFVVR